MIIITGANSPLGIGLASAHLFAANGARAIFLCDLNNTHLDSHISTLSFLYPSTDFHGRQFDASDEEKVKGVVEECVERYGRLDIAFANAGMLGPQKAFGEIEGEEFMEVMRGNVLR